MSRIRFSKVRVTDHRPPPSAGWKPPLERSAATRGGSMTGLDHLTESQKREAAEHDRNLRDYTPDMVEAAFFDVSRRRLTEAEPLEARWLRARKAALLRLGLSMRERGLA